MLNKLNLCQNVVSFVRKSFERTTNNIIGTNSNIISSVIHLILALLATNVKARSPPMFEHGFTIIKIIKIFARQSFAQDTDNCFVC